MNLNFKTLFKKKRRGLGNRDLSIKRDWYIILAFFSVSLIVAVSVHMVIFWKIDRNEFFVGTNESGIVVDTIDRTTLKNIVDTLEAKSEMHDKLLESSPTRVDPSR